LNWLIEFHPTALRELGKLDPELKRQVLARLKSRLISPAVPKARLSGNSPDTYKIKLKKAGLRIVYQIHADVGKIRVLAIGRRDSDVYEHALRRESSDS
jgi:mRNA interferase RelE/StbE